MKKFNDQKVDLLKQLKEAQKQFTNLRADDYVELQKASNHINNLKQRINLERFEELNKKQLLEMQDLIQENEEDLKNLMAMHKKNINKMIEQHQKLLRVQERSHYDRKVRNNLEQKQRAEELDKQLNIKQLLSRQNTADITDLMRKEEECRQRGDYANAHKFKEKKTQLLEKQEKKLQLQKKRQIEQQIEQEEASWQKERQSTNEKHIKKLKIVEQKNEQELRILKQKQEKMFIHFKLMHKREEQSLT